MFIDVMMMLCICVLCACAFRQDDEPYVRLFVKVSSSKTVTLTVKASNTITNVKGKIKAVENLAKREQRLIFAGKEGQVELNDDLTLRSYNIKKESTLILDQPLEL